MPFPESVHVRCSDAAASSQTSLSFTHCSSFKGFSVRNRNANQHSEDHDSVECEDEHEEEGEQRPNRTEIVVPAPNLEAMHASWEAFHTRLQEYSDLSVDLQVEADFLQHLTLLLSKRIAQNKEHNLCCVVHTPPKRKNSTMDLKPLEMKGGVDALDESDDERHAHLADVHAAASSSASVALGGEGEGDGHDGLDGGSSAALFDEYYDDWAAFDHAVAVAIDKYHPIRKRSSLTFEVYNRTVSKGRHDRKSIAEFLSKTFKCTHGIKFRARGNGRRLRHKLRDIGCPFHVYASAVEFGATYRVKVRMQDKHNHPIGPDAIKNMPALHDSDYELGSENEAASSLSGSEMHAAASATALSTSAEMDLQVQFAQAQAAAQAHAQNQAQAQAHAHAVAQAQAHAQAQAQSQALAQAQAQVLLKAQTQAVEQAHAQVQEMLNAQAQAQALAQAQAQVQAHTQVQAQARAQAQAHALLQAAHEHDTDILDAAGVHESEALLASAIESSMGDDDDDFADTPKELHSPARFEETTTLESIRKKLAHFADQRDWNQFHTPRNLLLAMTGEVGELCEIFQWKNENKPIEDLPTAVQDKIAKNARKYPAELVKGSSKKYNEYKRRRIDHDSGNDGGQHDDGSNTNESTL